MYKRFDKQMRPALARHERRASDGRRDSACRMKAKKNNIWLRSVNTLAGCSWAGHDQLIRVGALANL